MSSRRREAVKRARDGTLVDVVFRTENYQVPRFFLEAAGIDTTDFEVRQPLALTEPQAIALLDVVESAGLADNLLFGAFLAVLYDAFGP